MNHELIKIENYLLVVSDEEIKVGDWFMDINSKTIHTCELAEGLFNTRKKIIAHLPLPINYDAYGQPLHYLDGVDVLPRLIGEAEQLANDYANEMRCDDGTTDEDFLQGFNKAKEIYKYTEKDLRRAIGCGMGLELWKEEEQINNFIQSLNQPKIPIAFECEPKYLDIDEIRERGKGFLNGNSIIKKTITNSQGRTEWVGKYLF
jgi:hypothetical protein